MEFNRLEIIEKMKALHHKPGVKKDDWDNVHPNLLVIAEYVLEHCFEHQLPLVITSIIRPKIKGVSKTDIHSTGRAFDVSVKGWQREDIEFLVDDINSQFNIGAISVKTGKENEAVYEDGVPISKGGSGGTGPHFHFQCRR